jgi:hypothetical protein
LIKEEPEIYVSRRFFDVLSFFANAPRSAKRDSFFGDFSINILSSTNSEKRNGKHYVNAQKDG